ncbi:MAG: glycosyltransferase family 2 protein [Nitrospirae bacterium]|nr:glycosyltransferase family 2 protein [Nitrospirota bacterium]
MSISVIIPTLNASALLDPIVRAIRGQLTAVAEIIVIDSASVDNSAAIAGSLGCKVIKIDRAAFNHGTTRNIAASAASGDVIIFMTQDALPADNRLTQELLVPLQDPQTAASYARQIAAADAAPVERFSREFNYPGIPILKSLDALNALGIKTFFFSNVCSAIKREVFMESGGFQSAIMNEDMLFASRLILSGYKVAYCPEAAVIHSHNYSFTKQFRRNFDIGVSLKEGRLLKYANPGGEGLRYLREGAARLLNEGKYSWLLYFILDSCFRYAGYSMGVRYDLLPKALRRWMSIHPFYFR